MDDIKFTTAGDMVGSPSNVRVEATVEFTLQRALIGDRLSENYVAEMIREALEDRISGVSEPDQSVAHSVRFSTPL